MSLPKNVPDVTHDEIKQMMEYHEDGSLTWRIQRGPFPSGTRVGTITNGRRQCSINNVRVYTANVVWFYHLGYFPVQKGFILDHKDGDSLNDRIGNLRPATQGKNRINASKRKNREHTGVYPRGDKFISKIQNEGVIHHLGTYNTVQEASAAYKGASLILHGEFSIFNRPEKENQ